MPVRDVLALYARLVRHQATPFPPLAAPEVNYPLGHERGFSMSNMEGRLLW
jgi:hypothetical protein